jgi:hypothetical protein
MTRYLNFGRKKGEKNTRSAVCFFVSCNRHRDWFNRVPGPVTNLGVASIIGVAKRYILAGAFGELA